MPAVTVILPCHNGENYLRESIDSVLAQTFTDFELHVLDDGSTDTSAEITKSYSDPRVRYSKNPEKFGLFKTLNRGCREAQSEWVRIWAHDDRMLPDGLEKHMAFVRKHSDVGLVYCEFIEIDGDGKRTGRDSIFKAMRERTPDVADSELSALLFFVYGCLPGNISTVMLSRKAWETTGGFLEGIQQSPDYEMWVRVSQTYPVGFVRDQLIELREHPLQLGRLGTKQMTTIDEEILVIRQLRERLKGKVPEKELDKYWRHHRGRQHVHWVVRALLRRDFAMAKKGWQGIKQYNQRMGQFCHWLYSANGRFATVNSERYFDNYKDAFKNHGGSP